MPASKAITAGIDGGIMSKSKNTKCYIEEYEVGPGQIGARLREKVTGRKVDLGITLDGKQDFLRFLGSARANVGLMPEVFSKDNLDDCVLVSGDVDFDAPDEMRYVYNDKLSYLFG